MTDQQTVLGIDIAKSSFAAALFRPEPEQWLQRKFSNSAAGHRKLLHWLAQHGAQPCLAGMEATGNHAQELLHRLHEDDHRCFLLAPGKVKYHLRARGQGNKTDRQDALGIAHYLIAHNPRPWFPPSVQRRQAQALFQVLLALKRGRQRNKNRISAALDQQVRGVWTTVLSALELAIQKTTAAIIALVQADQQMARAWKLYLSVSGVGPT